MVVQNITLQPITPFARWDEIPDHELSQLLQKVQNVYKDVLAKGYQISFGQTPLEGIEIIASQTRGKDEELPQINQPSCSFCEIVKEGPQNPTLIKKSAHFSTLRSLSHQVLLIPNQHCSHWFKAPINTQLTLFKEALRLRQECSPAAIQRDIELHCGSIAGQTIPHLHVRTGIYLNT